jgi:hypothetical protein
VTARHLIAPPLTALGAAGVTACLFSAFTGMRDVMVTDGGFCASGGPYVIAHQCTGADMRLLMVSILGMLVSAGCYLAGTRMLGGWTGTAGLLVWAALFGTLGWNFIDLGLHPPAGMNGAGGWLFSGVTFWLMAAGGLIPVIVSAAGWLRRGGRPQPSLTAAAQPTVWAQFPGMGGGRSGMEGGQSGMEGGRFGMGGNQFGMGGGQFGGAPPNPGGAPKRLKLPQPEDSP